MFILDVMCTGKVVETQVVARTVIHKNTKLNTVNGGDVNVVVSRVCYVYARHGVLTER